MRKKFLPLLLALSLALECMASTAIAAEPETSDESRPTVGDTAADKDKPASAGEESQSVGEPEQTSDMGVRTNGEAEVMADFTTLMDTWGGIVWSLTPEGTLTISAAPGAADSGVMPSNEYGTAPWTKYLTNGVSLYELIVREGVTSIGISAFYGQTNLRRVTFPNSLKSIGLNAFRNCTGISEITLPPSLERIDDSAFWGCTALTGAIVISGSCKTVGTNAFRDTSITELTLSKGVEVIGHSAFNGCAKLIGVILPSTIKSVGESAFAYCGAETVYINPTNGAVFGQQAFEGCKSLTTLQIDPNSITEIPYAMFKLCEKLEKVSLPEGIKTIGSDAFTKCSALTEIELPNSLNTLGEYAFSSCTSLKSITIPDKVRKVEKGAFHNCTALTTVVLGEKVREIGSYAFDYCPGLTNLTLYYNLWTVVENVFKGSSPLDVTFYGTEAEWQALCGYTHNNDRLTMVAPTFIPVIHTELTWDHETIDSVAEAAANRVSLTLDVERPSDDIAGASTPVTAMAAAYDKTGKMLGIFSGEVAENGSVLNIKLPSNAVSIKIMLVDGDTAPLLPAKIIT